jgi:hypothetical protein
MTPIIVPFDFNRETMGSAPLPLARDRETSANTASIGRKGRHAEHARHLPVALDRECTISVRPARGPNDEAISLY